MKTAINVSAGVGLGLMFLAAFSARRVGFMGLLPALVLGLSFMALAGCAAMGTQTYPVQPAQLDCARACFHIPACPAGKTNLAGLVSHDAGGLVSVQCDVGGMVP